MNDQEKLAQAWLERLNQEGDPVRMRVLDPLFADWLSTLRPGEILDIGCGEGRYSRKAKNQQMRVTGIDTNRHLIDHAKTLDKRTIYSVASADNLPFEDGSFDHAFCIGTLPNIDRIDLTVAEASRVIRKGGSFFVATLNSFFTSRSGSGWLENREMGSPVYAIGRYSQRREIDMGASSTPTFHRTQEEYMGAFLSAGLILEVYKEPIPTEINDSFSEHCERPVKVLWPVTADPCYAADAA